MSATQDLNETQLGAARSVAWKQAGEPLLTLEAARDWVNEYGLVLFAPRAQQLPAPAPSLVEAALGAAHAAPSMAEAGAARGLVARLVGEGLAVPLNLLGVPGDTPDFVVSAQVFSYVFTLRGDKAWKQAPSTSGAAKVSPLGLRVFEVLTERGAMTAPELAQELGREVTETAIVRALSELWSQLRVIPLLGQGAQGDGATLWELTSRRFTKAIKSGANAGQPTALSALVSLYLAQVFAATEEEIVTFLSPLTARSRVREVLHALLGARQLETVVIEGRTLLHLPGGLPAAVSAKDALAEGEAEAGETAEAVAPPLPQPKKIGTGRIQSFRSETKDAAAFRGKPVERSVARPAGRSSERPAWRGSDKPMGRGTDRPSRPSGRTFAAGRAGAAPVKRSALGGARFGAPPDRKSEQQRRPFKRDDAGSRAASGAEKKQSFTRPWDEERRPRPASAAKVDGFAKFRRAAAEDRPRPGEHLGERERAGLPPERRGAGRSTFAGGSKSAGRPNVTGKPKFAGKPKFDRAAKPSFAGKPKFDRAGKSTFAGKPKFGSASKSGGFMNKPFAARGGEGAAKPFAKRPFTKKPYAPRAAEAEASGARQEGGERTLPKRPYKPRAADADKRIFTKKPWTPKEDEDGKRPYKPRTEGGYRQAGVGHAGAGARKSFAARPAGKFGGKPKFSSKPGGFGAKRGGSVAGAKRKKPGAEESES